jgi:hypothetical protein
MTTLRIHRDIFPRTDHGYTWVEAVWFERGEERVSPIIPAAGCCERLSSMPGGPVLCDLRSEEKFYAPEGVTRIERSETTHDGFYRVGTVCITKESD